MKEIKLSRIVGIKNYMDLLYSNGGDAAIKQYIDCMLRANSYPEDVAAIIHMIKVMGLYPKHKHFVETLITFG